VIGKPLLAVCVVAASLGLPMTTATQLTHVANGQGVPTNDEPFPSPDGRELVIESNRTGKQQLYAISTAGMLLRRITTDAGSDDSPSWSHDGTRIAYISIRHGRSGIYAIDTMGRHERMLASDGLDYLHPMWSSDDRWIMYDVNSAREPSIYELWAMRTDGSGRHQITHIHASETTYGSWSPDGKEIVFRRKFPPYRSQVYVAESDGTKQRDLAVSNSYDGWPSWSPDGKHIVFSSNRLEPDPRSHDSEIFVMASDGSGLRLVARAGGRNTEPRFSPDGRTVYFSHCTRAGCQVYSAAIDLTAPPGAAMLGTAVRSEETRTTGGRRASAASYREARMRPQARPSHALCRRARCR